MIPVPEAALPYVSRGRTAAVMVDAFPKRVFAGAVTRSASAVDPRSRTMLAEVDLRNVDGRLGRG